MTRLLFAIAATLLVASVRLPASDAPAARPAKAMTLLKANCLSCHNEEKKKGGLVLATRDAALKGGENGAVLVPGKSAESQMIKSLTAEADPHMPPKKQLAEKDIASLRAWIDGGAAWDEKALASFGADAPVEKLTALPSSYQPVLALALSPDDKRLAVARANTVFLHDLTRTNFPAVTTLAPHRDAVQSLAWSKDGATLAAAEYRRVALWNAKDGALTRELTNFTGRVNAVQFTPDGAALIAADGVPTKSGLLHLIATADGHELTNWVAHKDSILSLHLSRDGQSLATASADKTVKIWNFATRQETAKLEAHLGHVLATAFNADASFLATAGMDKVLNLWDPKTRGQEITLKHASPITALAWTADGKSLFSATEDGHVRMFSEFKTHTGGESSETARDRKLAATDETLCALAVSADGKTICAGSHEGNVFIWNAEGKLKATLAPERGAQLAEKAGQ
ncbi:MAG: hypothetical protein HY301_10425 [Verrucomicrobia bacterium]|nr:hypothetical protein [Verrucomicrobiota bacterium]